jgi:hypothetical protein
MNHLKLALAGLILLAFAALGTTPVEAVQLCNNAWMSTATSGTGTITLGSALSGAQSFADCGITNGQVVRYRIFDGAAWEVGSGTYTSAGTTLSRTVLESSNSDTAISLSGTATVIITPLTSDLPSETTPIEATPTASDYLFMLQSGVFERVQISALETTFEGFLDAADLQGDIALTTDTSGDYVATVADGTGIDGTATGEGSTFTPLLDLTEINSVSWGSGNSFTTMDFNSGAGRPTFFFGNATTSYFSSDGNAPSFRIDDEGSLHFGEEDGGGNNFKAFKSPAAITTDTTCTFEDDAHFIPDSCVGDGSDDDVPESGDFGALTGGTGVDNTAGTLDFNATEVTTATWGNGNFTDMVFSGAGAIDLTLNFATSNRAIITQTDAGAAGPILNPYHNSATPAANDVIFELLADGEDGAGNTQNYARIQAIITDPTSTSEDARIDIAAVEGGAFGNGIRIDGAGIYPDVSQGMTLGTFDDRPFSSLYVRDSVELDDEAVLRFGEAEANGDNFLAFVAPAAITSDSTCILENDAHPIPDSCVGDGVDGGGGLTDPATLESTDAGATAGPTFNLYRNSASPADADDIGQLVFQGEDESGNTQTYATISTEIRDATNATEDAHLIFSVQNGGTLVEEFRIDDWGVLVGGDPSGFSTGTPYGSGVRPSIQALGDTFDEAAMLIARYSTTDSAPPGLIIAKSGNATVTSHTVVADNEQLGVISFQGSDGTDFEESVEIAAVVDGTPGADDVPGELQIRIDDAGANSLDAVFSFLKNGYTLQYGSRAEHELYQGGNDAVGPEIFGNKTRNADPFTHTVTVDGDDTLVLGGWASDGTDFEPTSDIRFEVDGEPATAADTTDMPGRIRFHTTPDGSDVLTEAMRIDNNQVLALGGVGSISTFVANTVRPKLQVLGTSGPTGAVGVARFSADAGGARYIMSKSRGASVGTYTVPTDGDTLGELRGESADGTLFDLAASIQFQADGEHGTAGDTSDSPGRIAFITSANGTSSETERFRISEFGGWGIGGANFGTTGQVMRSAGSAAAPTWANNLSSFCVKLGNMTDAITTGDGKNRIHMPYAFTVTAVNASVFTESSSGTVNIAIREDTDAEGGTAAADILSTDIDIEANERRSSTATTQPVVSDTSLAANSEILFDIDTAGTGAIAPLVCIVGYPT